MEAYCHLLPFLARAVPQGEDAMQFLGEVIIPSGLWVGACPQTVRG